MNVKYRLTVLCTIVIVSTSVTCLHVSADLILCKLFILVFPWFLDGKWLNILYTFIFQPMLALTWCTKASIFTSQKLTTSHYVRTVPSCASSGASTAMLFAFAMCWKIHLLPSSSASLKQSTINCAAPIPSLEKKIESKYCTCAFGWRYDFITRLISGIPFWNIFIFFIQ